MTKTRLLAALIMAPVAIAAILLLSTPWIVALAAVVFLAGLWEWFELAEIEDTLARTVLLVAHLALMVAIVWASRSASGYSYVLFQLASVIGVVWWLLALLWLRNYDFASNHESWARFFKLAAGALAIIPAWCALAWIHASEPNGHVWLFTALAIVWAADSAAYFAGRHFGGTLFKGRKLAPRVSPNKTIEGLAGGMLLAVVAGVVFAIVGVHPFDQWQEGLKVGVLVALVAPLGDLAESLVKRDLGIKDMGSILPGHGGLMDRLDSLLLVAPVVWALLAVFVPSS